MAVSVPGIQASSARSARGGRGWNHCDQATKGVWWMPRHQEAMTGVEGCDMSGGAVKQAMIPEFPNDHRLNP